MFWARKKKKLKTTGMISTGTSATAPQPEAGAAICLAYMNEKAEDYDKIRQGFQICSGYHTLQAELDWIKHMDKESLWSSQALGPITLCKCLLVPGSTKQMMMCALWAGVERHRTAFVSFMNLTATVAALFLSTTVSLILTPPDYIVNPYDPSPFILGDEGANPDHFLMFTRAYMSFLYMSAGSSFALVIVSSYAAAWDLAVVRDADWIRMMSNYGDCVLWWQVWFLALTIIGIVLPCCVSLFFVDQNHISGWIAWTNEENLKNLGTKPQMAHFPIACVFLFIGLLLNVLITALMDAKGNVVNYYLNAESHPEDTPDFDLLVSEFEEKMKVSSGLVEADQSIRLSNIKLEANVANDANVSPAMQHYIVPSTGYFPGANGFSNFAPGPIPITVMGARFGTSDSQSDADKMHVDKILQAATLAENLKQRIAASQMLLDDEIITKVEFDMQRAVILASI